MDGLECSEVTFNQAKNNKDFRIDSGFYTTKLYRNANLTYVPIGSCLLESKYGISVDMNDTGRGYPIYRMNEIHNMLCDLDVAKYADISIAEFKKFKLNDGDVLFNRTNSYDWVGRTGIYYDIGTPQVYASYLVRFVPDRSKIQPEFLTAFLSCQYGVADVKRRARQSINQTNVNPEEVKEIAIPLLSESMQKAIKKCFRTAHEARLAAQTIYAKAEQQLSAALELSQLSASQQAVSVKTLSESFGSSGRLDAEYYQPKYDELLSSLDKQTTQPLGGKDGIVTIKKSIEPGSDAYCDEGIPFVRVSDVTKYGISDTEIHLSRDVASDVTTLFPRKDTILFSKDGSVGIAYKAEHDLEVITSGALLHLTVKEAKKVLPDYLTLVLNSKVVQLQAERDSSGAIIQHWKPSEIEKVVIPVVDIEIQKQIASKVQESFALRHQSEQLLENAKHAVEIAIEQGEDQAMTWLKEKGVEC